MAKEENLKSLQERLANLKKDIALKETKLSKMSDGMLKEDLRKEIEVDKRTSKYIQNQIRNITKQGKKDKITEKYEMTEMEFGTSKLEKELSNLQSSKEELKSIEESLKGSLSKEDKKKLLTRKNQLEQEIAKHDESKLIADIKEAKGLQEAKLEAKLSSLDKEIAGKTEALNKLPAGEAREKLEESIEKLKREKNRIEGYKKNKNKIAKIRDYQRKLNARIPKLKEQQKKLRDEKKDIEEDIKRAKSALEANKNIKTEDLDNNEYEQYKQLLVDIQQREELLKVKDQEIKKIDSQIVTIKRAISKCNLAWKTLYANKDWDEINRRALNGRFVKQEEPEKIDEQAKETKPEEVERKAEEPTPAAIVESKQEKGLNENEEVARYTEALRKETEKMEKEINGEVQEENEEEMALAPVKKSWWSRLKERISNSLPWRRNKLDMEERPEEEHQEESKQNIEEKVQENQEQVKDSQPQVKRDAFIEELRLMVEKEEKPEKHLSEQRNAIQMEKTMAGKEEARRKAAEKAKLSKQPEEPVAENNNEQEESR